VAEGKYYGKYGSWELRVKSWECTMYRSGQERAVIVFNLYICLSYPPPTLFVVFFVGSLDF